ncbi:hypothetical protein OKW43_005141 [Paraburkholderia sp. WC7.3g]
MRPSVRGPSEPLAVSPEWAVGDETGLQISDQPYGSLEESSTPVAKPIEGLATFETSESRSTSCR